MAVTIKDVASIAGVSRATVSRVLNGSARVSPEKVRAVQEAITRTGFEVSIAARRLATGETESIAVVLTEPVDQLFHDPTYTAILRGIMEGIADTNFSPILISASNVKEREKALRLLSQKIADAIIHMSPYADDHLLADPVLATVPLVLCGRASSAHRIRPHSTVYSDDVIGARSAGEYLLTQGTVRALPLMGPEDNPATQDRIRGYRDALGGALLPTALTGDWTEKSGFVRMSQLLGQEVFFDAVVAGNDRIAAGAIRALKEAGVDVPGQVRVFGFDDHAVSVESEPTISTVKQPFRKQGEIAVELALALIHGSEPKQVLLPSRLVLRQSA